MIRETKGMAQGQREKRRAKRVPVSLTAHARIGTRFTKDPVADLSQSGLYLRTREAVKEGVPVRVALALPSADGPRFCTLAGTVARIDRDEKGRLLGIGVRFAEEQIAPSDRDVLDGFLQAAATTQA